MYQNSPSGLVNVNEAGSWTNFWDACLVLPPKAEKGSDTIKTAQPKTVATIPNGLARIRSAVIRAPLFSSSTACPCARAEVPNGIKTRVIISNNTVDCFVILFMFSSFRVACYLLICFFFKVDA